MNTDTANEIQQPLSWSLALGVVMALLGVGAILEPFVATIAVAIARMIKDIERQVRAKDSTEGPFAKLREHFSSFLKRRSEKVSKSAQEGQQATNSQAN
jgi:hypothetical protein